MESNVFLILDDDEFFVGKLEQFFFPENNDRKNLGNELFNIISGILSEIEDSDRLKKKITIELR